MATKRNPGALYRVFFLTGALRSGSTLLRLMLGQHTSISRCDEMEYLPPLIREQALRMDPQQAHGFLRLDRNFIDSDFQFDVERPVEESLLHFLDQRYATDQAPWVAATVHNHFEALPDIWPDAKFIFLHRDPRDVARSSVKMGWAGNPWGGALTWLSAQRSLAELRKVVESDQILEVRFEELVREPEQELARICRYLDLSFQSDMLAIDRNSTYKPPSRDEARSWRDDASELEIQQVEARIGSSSMLSAGYTPSRTAPLELTPFRRLSLNFENWWKRLVLRVERQGVILVLAHQIANRLKIRWLKAWATPRTHAIARSRLK